MSGHPNSLCTVLCAAILYTCVNNALYLPIDPYLWPSLSLLSCKRWGLKGL